MLFHSKKTVACAGPGISSHARRYSHCAVAFRVTPGIGARLVWVTGTSASCWCTEPVLRLIRTASADPLAGTRKRHFLQGGILMLVLSRKLGERIMVPHCELTVTIVAIDGNNVRIGISAPDDVAVYREEVWLSGPATGKLACEKVSAHEGQRRPR
jgi:carbon storage regulator